MSQGPGWSPDAPASATDILIALRFAERAARKAIGEELTGTGVHIGQELVLVKLQHLGALPVAQLAKVLDVEVPTASRTAQRMEAAGLVRRVKATDGDARLVSIELTDAGIEAATTVRAVHAKAARRAIREMTKLFTAQRLPEAAAIVFLCSSRTTATTGEIVRVNGGTVMAA